MPKVLLIGWDAADWKVINPLMDAGQMPSLQSLVNNGVKGSMATLDPPLSPMLWTSIATGKRPYKHGIHGFTEPTPDGKGIRPIYNTSRQCKAIWNILSQNDKKTNVVGWWPSHPAEPVNGIMLSNFYQRNQLNENGIWELAKGTVHPSDKADFFSKLRVHPHEITANHIAPFVPGFAKIDQSLDRRLNAIAKNIADSSSIHCAATYIMENEEWDFMAVYYDAIDHFCHGFMKYHPPRRSHIPLQDYEMYKEVVAGAYRFHDMMLGRLLELAGDDTIVMLISDHGFHPDKNRPIAIPEEPTGPAVEHSPYGIIVMKGPGIKKDELIFGASLLDITPTLLHIFGLPTAMDMDGKILLQAFENEQPVETIQSWENIPGKDGRHVPGTVTENEDEMRSELQQLIDLGYVADPGKDMEVAIQKTVEENNFNLARACINGQQWQEGIKLLEELYENNPGTLRFASYLANAYINVGKFKKAREVVDHIRDIMDRENPQMDLLEGTLLVAENRPQKALALFKKVEQEAGAHQHLMLRIANAYLQMNELEAAESILSTVVQDNPEEAGIWHVLGICRYKMGKYQEAVEDLLRSIGLLYYHAPAHFYLAESLLALEKYESAVNAYDVCLRIAPAMNIARQRIITIYEQYLEQPGRALKYKHDFTKSIKGEITIVSGLPRSGTSMMMQMLQAGGLAIFSDNARKPDENNLKGYYEHEAVKNLAKDKSWLPAATGKVVKVIAHLLPQLPMHYKYRVIFMERDISEIIRSQQKMLNRNGILARSENYPLQLVTAYESSLVKIKDWLANQPNIDVHYVSYASVINNPFPESIYLGDFLETALDVEKMSGAVDVLLHRERAGAS